MVYGWTDGGERGGYILGGNVGVLVGKEENKYWEGRGVNLGVCDGGGFIEVLMCEGNVLRWIQKSHYGNR